MRITKVSLDSKIQNKYFNPGTAMVKLTKVQIQFKLENIPSTYPDGALPRVISDSTFSNYLKSVPKLIKD